MAPRRSLDETRALLLDAGAAMLIESGLAITLDEVNLIDVCRAAGLSTAGSAYKIWATQHDFRTELLEYLVVRSSAAFATIDAVDGTFADGPELPPLSEVIRTAAAANAALNRSIYPTYVTVWLARRSDEALDAAFRSSERAWVAALIDFFERIMERYDLQFVPPFDAAALGVTISSLVEGLTIRQRATPELVPDAIARPTGTDGAEQPWHPFAIGVEAIFDAWTRPRATDARDEGTRTR